ncbi:MAG: adenylate/guanylate cyclase domain-containing protein [Victivallales bacterium]|nr:adenylate/guanylate cyclase domain-containing protein [Victivallales bacterium]
MDENWWPAAILFFLAGAALSWLLSRGIAYRHRQKDGGETLAELRQQKYSLAESSLQLLEKNELLNDKTRELKDKQLLLETNRTLLEQQKFKLAEVNQKLFELNEELEQEKEKSEKLLLNILPPHVADALKKYGCTEPELFENAVVMFTDFVGFTEMSSQVPPRELIGELNELFTGFDNIIEKHGCERIKTIGDAYLAIDGIKPGRDHAVTAMLDSALDIITYLKAYNAAAVRQWRIRIGIHTGSVVGGVVGIKKYIYDIFGDTVNTAARLEQHSEAMKINVSDTIRQTAGERYHFIPRSKLEVKGKGQFPMFFLESAPDPAPDRGL